MLTSNWMASPGSWSMHALWNTAQREYFLLRWYLWKKNAIPYLKELGSCFNSLKNMWGFLLSDWYITASRHETNWYSIEFNSVQFNSTLFIWHLLRSRFSLGALQKPRGWPLRQEQLQEKLSFNRKKPVVGPGSHGWGTLLLMTKE